jgi:hypothetical protein
MPNVLSWERQNIIFWRLDIMLEGLEVVMATPGTF